MTCIPFGYRHNESKHLAVSVSRDRQTAELNTGRAAASHSISEKIGKVFRKRKWNLAAQGVKNIHLNEDPKVRTRHLCTRNLGGGDI